MLRTEVVKLADIRPDENNPRKEFDGLEELVEQFKHTPDRPNEPFTPLIVVKDGNIYRIVDGERRYRALILGKKVDEVLCNVADTFEEAHSVAMMLATDNKAPLTDEERSQGVQTMLCLGVDYESVDALGKLKAGTASKIKTALSSRRNHNVSPIQANMDDLIKIAEIDNPHRMSELVEIAEKNPDRGRESEFRKKLEDYSAEATGIRVYQMFRKLFESLDIPVFENEPDLTVWRKYDTMRSKDEQSALECINEIFDDLDKEGIAHDELRAYIFKGGQLDQADQWGWKPSSRADLYVPDVDSDKDANSVETPEDLEYKAACEEFDHAFTEAYERGFRWTLQNSDTVLNGTFGEHAIKEASKLIDKTLKRAYESELPLDIKPQSWMIAAFYPKSIGDWDSSLLRELYISGSIDQEWKISRLNTAIRQYRSITSMLTADGYELNEFEVALDDAIETYLSGVKEADGDKAETA